jgi:site-specific DNA-methyltransferase (adenine-specific)
MENIQLYNNDCILTLNNLVKDKVKVNLTFTSPPYNMRLRVSNNKYIKRSSNVDSHIAYKYQGFSDDLSISEYYDFHSNVIDLLLKISDIVIWNMQIVGGSKEALFQIIGNYRDYLKDIIIWDKCNNQPSIQPKILNSSYEMLLIFESDKRLSRTINNATFNHGELSNLWRISSRKKTKFDGHSASFPLVLSDKVIRNFSRTGNVILDPFMGTGTVGVSALNLDRSFIGIELDENYYKIAQDRIKLAQDIKDRDIFK